MTCTTPISSTSPSSRKSPRTLSASSSIQFSPGFRDLGERDRVWDPLSSSLSALAGCRSFFGRREAKDLCSCPSSSSFPDGWWCEDLGLWWWGGGVGVCAAGSLNFGRDGERSSNERGVGADWWRDHRHLPSPSVRSFLNPESVFYCDCCYYHLVWDMCGNFCRFMEF